MPEITESMAPEPTSASPFKLSVTNFGPIARANVDLRPLSVLVGPNHVGKSYLAMLIYGLHQTYSRKILYGTQDGLIAQSLSTGFLRWSTETTDGLLFNWLDSLPFKPEPEVVKGSFGEIVHPVLATYTKALDTEIQRCFGVKLSSLIRKQSTGESRLILGRHEWDNDSMASPFETMVSFDRQSRMIPTFSNNTGGVDCDDEFWLKLTELIEDFNQVDDDRRVLWPKMDDLKMLLSDIIDPGIPEFFGVLSRPAFYLPANRAGAMQAYQVVANSLIERSMQPQDSDETMPENPAPSASGSFGIFTDFVKTLAGVHREQLQTNRELADKFEADILSGSIVTDFPEVGLPAYHYRPDGWKDCLHLSNTSAMVSNLASLAVYLRYCVRKGDLLIIEEPAAGMHRDGRTAFVRQLAAIVNTGIRIMVTVQDEWLLDELAKLIRPSGHPSGQGKSAVDANPVLTAEQVGVWSFETHRHPKGTVVTEIPFGVQSGFSLANRDEAIATGND